MSILAQASKGVLKQRPIILIYGAGGLGKDTFAAGFPRPVVIDVEKGTGHLNVERLVPDSFDSVSSMIKALVDEKHDYQTLVLSGLDVLESYLFGKIVKEDGNAKNIVQAAGGFGKGYSIALQYWVELQRSLQAVRNRGLYVICICHELVYSYNDPTAQAYDRFRLKLHEGSKESAARLWFDFADIVLFAKKKVYQVGDSNRAMDEGKHYIYTQGRAAFDAKSRYTLPFEMELNAVKFLAELDRGPMSPAELEKEARALAEQVKNPDMKKKILERIEQVKADANELRIRIQNIKTILEKE